ncbi:MAG: c-type cytochrome biogenesis protein CcmI [Polaromonas sp.]
MIAFWIVAVLLIAAALLFILTPLLRKEEVAHPHALRDEVNLMVLRDQLHELDADMAAGTIDAVAYESSRRELERRVAEDVQPGTALATAVPRKNTVGLLVGLSLPAIAVSLYFLLGNPGGLDPAQTAAPKEAAHEVTEEQIQSMVTALAQRLKDSPDDVQGWSMLARSYNALGRFSEASDAYARLVKLVPGNADMLADYADTLAMSLNKSLQGEPEKLITRALEADPKNIKALALSGSAAFERRDFPVAITQWKKILAIVPADSDLARSTNDSIGEAQKQATGKPALVPTPVAAAPSAAATAAGTTAAAAEVSGTVELDAALRSQVADTDTVFIFARAAQGPKFPLAVLRKQVKDLPVAFVLDDSMSMIPDAKLSSFPMVVVGARVSKSGSATPTPGDLEGLTEPVRPGAKNLKIRISTQRK